MNNTINNNTNETANVDVGELRDLLYSGNDKAYMILIDEVIKQLFFRKDLSIVLTDIGLKYIVANTVRKLRKEKDTRKFEFNEIEFERASNDFMHSEIINKIEELLNKDFVINDYHRQLESLYILYNTQTTDDESLKRFLFDMYFLWFDLVERYNGENGDKKVFNI